MREVAMIREKNAPHLIELPELSHASVWYIRKSYQCPLSVIRQPPFQTITVPQQHKNASVH